jgi:hypothetical protein
MVFSYTQSYELHLYPVILSIQKLIHPSILPFIHPANKLKEWSVSELVINSHPPPRIHSSIDHPYSSVRNSLVIVKVTRQPGKEVEKVAYPV